MPKKGQALIWATNLLLANLDMRRIRDISTGKIAPNIYVGRKIGFGARRYARAVKNRLKRLLPGGTPPAP